MIKKKWLLLLLFFVAGICSYSYEPKEIDGDVNVVSIWEDGHSTDFEDESSGLLLSSEATCEMQQIQEFNPDEFIAPEYPEDGTAYVEINNNEPYFTNEEKQCIDEFEFYSDLDELGRCGYAFANISPYTMPTEERGEIGHIRPSGWHTVKYNGLVEGNYLYNRCHMIGFQLAGENANEKNLITGTRYLNVVGMLDFENEVANYVRETGNHVLYRVTPIFEDDNLVAAGVLMEAWSVEDNGEGVCFNVYCFNIQPGIVIDYETGESRLEE